MDFYIAHEEMIRGGLGALLLFISYKFWRANYDLTAIAVFVITLVLYFYTPIVFNSQHENKQTKDK